MSRGWPRVEVRLIDGGHRHAVGFVWENTRWRADGRTELWTEVAVCVFPENAEMVAEGLRMRVAWDRGYVMPPKGDRPILTVTEREGMVTEFGSVDL